jgi:hypothetical protein
MWIIEYNNPTSPSLSSWEPMTKNWFKYCSREIFSRNAEGYRAMNPTTIKKCMTAMKNVVVWYKREHFRLRNVEDDSILPAELV